LPLSWAIAWPVKPAPANASTPAAHTIRRKCPAPRHEGFGLANMKVIVGSFGLSWSSGSIVIVPGIVPRRHVRHMPQAT
jgi:hypothetical protein